MSSQNVSSSAGTTSRRARTANKIISLAGLGGNKIASSSTTGTGSTFPTFRFSPENEEIHEVLSSSVTYLPEEIGVGLDHTMVTGNGEQGFSHSESLPSSPKPGDTSPIKEYIRKNWTNKWDKKSLSLDLDLRGKIKTVIEDKRKSIVSHFIPEETGIIPAPSTTVPIPESDSNRIFAYDNTTQKVTSNITQQPAKLTHHAPAEEYEEIGVDFLACLEEEGALDEHLSSDKVDMGNLTWICPPASCVEKFEGVLASIESEPTGSPLDNKDLFIPVTTQVLNFGTELLQHFLTKVIIGLLGAAILLPSFLTAFITFICGMLVTMVVSQTVSQFKWWPQMSEGDGDGQKRQDRSRSSSPVPKRNSNAGQSPPMTLQLSPKSQGWMLLFDEPYNPNVTNFHHADSVFLRLDSSTLYMSTPKHQVPKRKLWNDPPFTHDIKFLRHLIFNLAGAEVFIAPKKLASRRVWNKKYPIGIRLASPSYSWQVTRVSELPSASSNQTTPTDSIADNSGSSTNSAKPNGGGTPKTAARRHSAITLVKDDKEFSRKNSAGKVFYLFSRTCREKEDWFRRLINAAKMKVGDSGEEDVTPVPDEHQEYLRYMETIIPDLENSFRESGPDEGKMTSHRKRSTSEESEEPAVVVVPASAHNTPAEDFLDIESILTIPQSPMFLNAFLGRILYDALRSPYWSLQLQNMIQRKLNFLKRPPFVEVLNVKDLDLGGSFPIIQRASSPIIDSRGLWIDLDVTYEGSFCLTLETKVNLMKLRKSPTNDEEPLSQGQESKGNGKEQEAKERLHDEDDALVGNLYDSEAEDSGESSEEEFDPEAFGKGEDSSWEGWDTGRHKTVTNSPPQSSRRGKLMKMVEKTSNFVSEMNFVKNAVGKFANTPLLLTVELKELSGTIALNVPSPPTNRLWIGFRTKPEMKLVTTPRVGERQVNLSPLTDWIQKKIHQQLQRVLVLPNMDDTTIKLMEFKLPS